MDFAEMDSPISKTGMHPYGRRRTGTKAGAETYVRSTAGMYTFVFIRVQMYKLN